MTAKRLKETGRTAQGVRLAACTLVAALSGSGWAQLQITAGSGPGERQPVISGDGRTVAYVAPSPQGSPSIFTVGPDGGPAIQRTSYIGVQLTSAYWFSWPSISISDDGSLVAFVSNLGTLHTVNLLTGGMTTLLSASWSANYPRLDPGGNFVVYGGGGGLYAIATTGGAPILLVPPGSGPIFSEVREGIVVYQSGAEVFTVPLTGGTPTQVTTGSGGFNRYARLVPGTTHAVYQAYVSGALILRSVDVAVGPSSQSTIVGPMVGERLPVPTADGEVYFEAVINNLQEVHRVNLDGTGILPSTAGSGSGLRRPHPDLHGHVIVYQAPVAGGGYEVFRIRTCADATIQPYGAAGLPSVGTLVATADWYRCTLRLGLVTNLVPGTLAFLAIGTAAQSPGLAIPGASGNLLHVSLTPPAAFLIAPLTLDTGSGAGIGFPIPVGLSGTFFSQWAVVDPPANLAGIVTGSGLTITF